jgi:hypothetical protein
METNSSLSEAIARPRRGGRKPADESRAEELRERLVKWSYFPANARPSLRVLAKALQTSHQLLSHLLVDLEEWEREKDLERCRVVTKPHGIVWTEAHQMKVHSKLRQSRRKYALSWVEDMPEHQAYVEKTRKLFLAKFGAVLCEKWGLLTPKDPMEMWTKPPEGLDTWRMLWAE